MSHMPEAGRQAAHVLLDTVTAFDPDLGEDDRNGAAMNLAHERLNEVGAAEATYNDDTDQVTIDITGLLGGAVVTIHWLTLLVAEVAGISQEDVIVKAREFIDSDES